VATQEARGRLRRRVRDPQDRAAESPEAAPGQSLNVSA
jgi:hypothetical protein